MFVDMWADRDKAQCGDNCECCPQPFNNAESRNLGLFGHSTLQHYHDGMPWRSYQKPRTSEQQKVVLRREERVEDEEFVYVTYSGSLTFSSFLCISENHLIIMVAVLCRVWWCL